jgi:hypothetical protein
MMNACNATRIVSCQGSCIDYRALAASRATDHIRISLVATNRHRALSALSAPSTLPITSLIQRTKFMVQKAPRIGDNTSYDLAETHTWTEMTDQNIPLDHNLWRGSPAHVLIDLIIYLISINDIQPMLLC